MREKRGDGRWWFVMGGNGKLTKYPNKILNFKTTPKYIYSEKFLKYDATVLFLKNIPQNT